MAYARKEGCSFDATYRLRVRDEMRLLDEQRLLMTEAQSLPPREAYDRVHGPNKPLHFGEPMTQQRRDFKSAFPTWPPSRRWLNSKSKS